VYDIICGNGRVKKSVCVNFAFLDIRDGKHEIDLLWPNHILTCNFRAYQHCLTTDDHDALFGSKGKKRRVLKRNPLKNMRVMMKLNPHAAAQSKMAKHIEEKHKKDKQALLDAKRGVCTNLYTSLLFTCMFVFCNL
jgi:hypothetical protein